MKHTPGPWTQLKWDRSPESQPDIEISSDHHPYWLAGVGSPSSDPETVEANARLIAAAPELFETLLRVVKKIDDASGQPSFTANESAEINALIAKAQGA